MDTPSKGIVPARKKTKKKDLIVKDVITDGVPDVNDGVPDVNDEIDRVGNISQKELALSISGVTRRRVYEEIGGMLRAMKKVDRMNGGVIVEEEEPDMVMRARGVELALKAFGDLKEFERVGGNVTHNTVVYQWKDSPTVVQNNISPDSSNISGGR